MTDIKKEFQRVFEFVVKHGPKINWPNRSIKNFLIWAWDNKHLQILYDGQGDSKRIAAVAIVWQQDHPENVYENFENYDDKEGDYLSVYGVIVHPEYRHRGCLLMLLIMSLAEYPKVKKVFWNTHARGKTGLRITDITTLGRELLKGANHVIRK